MVAVNSMAMAVVEIVDMVTIFNGLVATVFAVGVIVIVMGAVGKGVRHVVSFRMRNDMAIRTGLPTALSRSAAAVISLRYFLLLRWLCAFGTKTKEIESVIVDYKTRSTLDALAGAF